MSEQKLLPYEAQSYNKRHAEITLVKLERLIKEWFYDRESVNYEPKIQCLNQACVDAFNKAFIEAGKAQNNIVG